MATAELADNRSLSHSLETNPYLTSKQRKFLTAYAATGNVSEAAKLAGTSRRAHYDALTASEAYRQMFDACQKAAAKVLVADMLEQAIEGRKRYKFDSKGEPILHPETGQPYFEVEYDTIKQIYLTKTLAGMVEKQHQTIEHTGTVEKKLTVQVYLPGREQRGLAERVAQDEPATGPTVIEATGSKRNIE